MHVNHQQIISYASRALSDVEKRYSQTEKEALAIVWAVEHFHLFLYGSEFTLITDHKPFRGYLWTMQCENLSKNRTVGASSPAIRI